MAAVKPRLKPETLNMRGAAIRSLRTTLQHYIDWQRAVAEDLDTGASQADTETFLDWAKDTLEKST